MGRAPLTTRQDAEAFVAGCLGDHADDHDIPTITDVLHGIAGGSWDVQRVRADDFWEVVQAYAVAGAAQRRLADALVRRLNTAGIGAPEAAQLLDVPQAEAAAILGDLGHQRIDHLHQLAVAAGTRLSDLAREAGV